MADISKIKLPSGSVYNIKDEVARAALAGGVHLLGITTTPLTDGATTTSVVVNGETITASNGDLAIYNAAEFVFTTADNKWHAFGDLSGLGELAYKDEATGTFTPAGTVSQPTFTGDELTVTGKFTPEGEVSQPTFSGTEGDLSVSGTPTGSVEISKGNGTANYTPEGDVSQPTFTGDESDVSVSGTPTGSVTATKNESGNYAPAGDVSAPAVSLKTAGATQDVTPFGTAGTLPELNATVQDETLELTFDQGTLPTAGTPVTVKTGDAAYQASAPTFTGEKVQLAFAGNEMDSTGKFKPKGSVSQPTFTGKGVELAATFKGDKLTSTGKFTPSGSVSKPTFTGTEGDIEAKGTPTGAVSQPTFTGSQGQVTVS